MLIKSLVVQSLRKNKENQTLELRGNNINKDRQLQLSRRIDWRFLLPDPHLHQVGYLGSSDGTLIDALKYFSDSLTIISPSSQIFHAEESKAIFDLVVLCLQKSNDLEIANSLLIEGKYLYWEISNHHLFKSLSQISKQKFNNNYLFNLKFKDLLGLIHFQEYIELLEKKGFHDLEVYWHRPNFEACLEIIPINNKLAIDYVFNRTCDIFVGNLKRITGNYIMKTRFRMNLVPCLSIIARKNLSISSAL